MNLQAPDRTTPALPLLILLLAGCAPAAPAAAPPTALSAVESAPAPQVALGPVEAALQPPPATRRAMVSPTRSAEECAPLVERVRTHPDSFAVSGPMMAGFAIPPFEGTPRDLRGATVTILLLVDERGNVVSDSTTITPPISSPSFDRMLRERAAGFRFHPAVLEGCAVPGRSAVQLTLANR